MKDKQLESFISSEFAIKILLTAKMNGQSDIKIGRSIYALDALIEQVKDQASCPVIL
jgi:hypothetical protein